MSKTALLAAAAILALTSSAAWAAQPSIGVQGAVRGSAIHIAKGAKLLYNQNSNSDGVVIASMNFTSGAFSSQDSYGADDFLVPKNATWTVTEVDVSGTYYNGYGPATDENVVFYADAKGLPGKTVKKGKFSKISCTDNNGSFSCSLGKKGLKLAAGHYWVSVYTDQNFDNSGEWGWAINTQIHNYDAVWENPNNGFETGCTSWGELDSCVGNSADFMFDLQGKVKQAKK